MIMAKKLKVLIVEDEVIIAMRLEMYFSRKVFDVFKNLSNGKDAIKTAFEEKPDILY